MHLFGLQGCLVMNIMGQNKTGQQKYSTFQMSLKFNFKSSCSLVRNNYSTRVRHIYFTGSHNKIVLLLTAINT